MNEDPRTHPPREGDERASLTGFLDFQRQTLAVKCAGLNAEQLRRKTVPPSDMSLIGLVRHMAEIERGWFEKVMNGEQLDTYWGMRPDGDYAEFDVDDAEPDEAFAVWNKACARSSEIVAAIESLDTVRHHGDLGYSLRWVLIHMIEEYARHNGHADLLRERIDGETGE
ncbi:Mini-circle protein [Prauserella marina]|uniref:Uncharacterized protein n=1 Tax=Prauserella marina TaxID=530584 RepID=A0A222VMZ0_9PSEU|nr:DinB family protein [Prauserella marina]ASR35279.1 Mini-circle protein [Prauserella marina]PWV84945.1 uncharacterized protein DUF664 [Prauserella marina]SDC08681.1 Protein of unknown function [Prauserella marina]